MMISLTNTTQEQLSNVFDVIIFMQHINMMLQLFFIVSPAEKKWICVNDVQHKRTNLLSMRKTTAKKEQETDSASNWVISASSCSLLVCSSSISSSGLTLASSDTWSLEGQTGKKHT